MPDYYEVPPDHDDKIPSRVRNVDDGCPVHPIGGCDIETLEYDEENDLYLRRCTYTGKTWWARDDLGYLKAANEDDEGGEDI